MRFEDASRLRGVAVILGKTQKHHHINHLLYIEIRFNWKWYRFKHRRCPNRDPSPVQSAPRWRIALLARKFLSDQAIIFLSGLKTSSNCVKTRHRWPCETITSSASVVWTRSELERKRAQDCLTFSRRPELSFPLLIFLFLNTRVYQPRHCLFWPRWICCFAYGQKKANNPSLNQSRAERRILAPGCANASGATGLEDN